jgi:hypothetical protein
MHHEKGLVEWFKVKALTSSSSITKKKKVLLTQSISGLDISDLVFKKT